MKGGELYMACARRTTMLPESMTSVEMIPLRK